jgi:hypothetical protein
LPVSFIYSDIIFFQFSIDRKDNIGILAVVFQPYMLGQDKLDLRLRKALIYELLSFQQVIQQGVSVQIM